MDDHVIQTPVSQKEFQILKKYAAYRLVYRVKKNVFFVQYQITVIRNPPFGGVHALKDGEPAVVPADPIDSVCN
jgi:hypothetical protein